MARPAQWLSRFVEKSARLWLAIGADAAPGNSAMSTPSVPEPSAVADETRWFTNEVHPHERHLRSYLHGAFPTVREVDDVVQESYLQLLRARAARPIDCARAFLFGIARRVAVDVIRREKRTGAREVVMDIRSLNAVEDRAGVPEVVSIEEEIALLAEAIHSLPPRCREIMILRKLKRLSHREIAQTLNISIPTVEVQVSRGMEKCTQFMCSRGVDLPLRRRSR